MYNTNGGLANRLYSLFSALLLSRAIDSQFFCMIAYFCSIDDGQLYNEVFQIDIKSRLPRCSNFRIFDTSSSQVSNSLECWMMPYERYQNKDRRKFLIAVSDQKTRSFQQLLRNKSDIAVSSNCPLLYYWLHNGNNVDTFMRRGLLPSHMKNASPLEKTRFLFKKAFRDHFVVDSEVLSIKNAYKQQLMDYYCSHDSNVTMNLDSFNQFIAVHLRMGTPLSDFPEEFTYLQLDDLPVVINYIYSLNTSYPIFLATDSMKVKEFFTSIYQNRVILYNSKLDYTSDSHMMNKGGSVNNTVFKKKLAMADMILLSESSYLIGTDLSTYSTMAALIGNAQATFAKKNATILCSTCYAFSDYFCVY